MTEFFCLRMKVSVLVIDMPKPGPMLDSGQVIDAGDSHDHFADVYNYHPSHDHLSIINIFVVRDVPDPEIAKHACMIIGLAVEVNNCNNEPPPGKQSFFCLGLSENLSPN